MSVVYDPWQAAVSRQPERRGAPRAVSPALDPGSHRARHRIPPRFTTSAARRAWRSRLPLPETGSPLLEQVTGGADFVSFQREFVRYRFILSKWLPKQRCP